MRRPTTAPPQSRPPQARILPGDVVLTAADIIDLGLEAAPDGVGLSWEEIIDRKSRSTNHG